MRKTERLAYLQALPSLGQPSVEVRKNLLFSNSVFSSSGKERKFEMVDCTQGRLIALTLSFL